MENKDNQRSANHEEQGFGEYKEHVVPTWLLLALGAVVAILIFVLPLGELSPAEDKEKGSFAQLIDGIINKAEEFTAVFSSKTQEMTILAQDESYSITIPGEWLYYNEDYGDYFSAYPPDSSYYVVLSRTNKADYGENYDENTLAQWVFSSSCGEGCQPSFGEVENIQLGEFSAQKSLTIHNEVDGIYLEDIIFISGKESYYVLSFYCHEDLWQEGLPIWEDTYSSFLEHPVEKHIQSIYGVNDSVAFMEAENKNVMYHHPLGKAGITLYDDWVAEEYGQEGSLLFAYNYFQNKMLEISNEKKASSGVAQSFDEYLNEYKEKLHNNFSQEEIIEEGQLLINGLLAYKAVYIEDVYMESQITQAYIIEGEEDFYQIYISCPVSKYPRHNREFEYIVATFSE